MLVGAWGKWNWGGYDGVVRMYAGGELYLSPNLRAPSFDDALTLQTAQGVPGNPTLTALVDLDGVPKFVLLGPVAPFAADGTNLLAGKVPAGLAGHTILVQAYAIDAAGKPVRSIPEAITFR